MKTAEEYRRFGRVQARGRSPGYEALAYAVADDQDVLSFIEELPEPKRQPNLLFASARYLLGAPPGPGSLHELVIDRAQELKRLMLAKRTQTNEAARSSVLLPALASLPEPLPGGWLPGCRACRRGLAPSRARWSRSPGSQRSSRRVGRVDPVTFTALPPGRLPRYRRRFWRRRAQPQLTATLLNH